MLLTSARFHATGLFNENMRMRKEMLTYQLEAEKTNPYLPTGIVQRIYDHNKINPSLPNMLILNVLAPSTECLKRLPSNKVLMWGTVEKMQADAEGAGYATFKGFMQSKMKEHRLVHLPHQTYRNNGGTVDRDDDTDDDTDDEN
jgi:hypothetical protein